MNVHKQFGHSYEKMVSLRVERTLLDEAISELLEDRHAPDPPIKQGAGKHRGSR
jgi:hypothetical protein